MVQYEEPEWAPLMKVVGERLVEGFMWMQEDEMEDGRSLHAYKHRHTRCYLHLTDEGRAFEPTACGRFVPMRLDFAIQAALCPWWILWGWEQEDKDAVADAVQRAQQPAPP